MILLLTQIMFHITPNEATDTVEKIKRSPPPTQSGEDLYECQHTVDYIKTQFYPEPGATYALYSVDQNGQKGNTFMYANQIQARLRDPGPFFMKVKMNPQSTCDDCDHAFGIEKIPGNGFIFYQSFRLKFSVIQWLSENPIEDVDQETHDRLGKSRVLNYIEVHDLLYKIYKYLIFHSERLKKTEQMAKYILVQQAGNVRILYDVVSIINDVTPSLDELKKYQEIFEFVQTTRITIKEDIIDARDAYHAAIDVYGEQSVCNFAIYFFYTTRKFWKSTLGVNDFLQVIEEVEVSFHHKRHKNE